MEVTIEEPVPDSTTKLSAAPTVCIMDNDASMANSTRLLVQSFGPWCASFPNEPFNGDQLINALQSASFREVHEREEDGDPK